MFPEEFLAFRYRSNFPQSFAQTSSIPARQDHRSAIGSPSVEQDLNLRSSHVAHQHASSRRQLVFRFEPAAFHHFPANADSQRLHRMLPTIALLDRALHRQSILAAALQLRDRDYSSTFASPLQRPMSCRSSPFLAARVRFDEIQS